MSMAKSTATATAAPVDLEAGENNDRIATSGGTSSYTQDNTPSKAATPRRSLDFEKPQQPRPHSFVTKSWRRIEEKLPTPVTRLCRKACAWIKGPEIPVLHRIVPLFEPVQTFPARLVARLPKTVRFCLFAAGSVLWIVLFGVIISSFGLPADLAGYGAPVRLGCAAQLWCVDDILCTWRWALSDWIIGLTRRAVASTDAIAFLLTSPPSRSIVRQTV